jgi:hypothetical protein
MKHKYTIRAEHRVFIFKTLVNIVTTGLYMLKHTGLFFRKVADTLYKVPWFVQQADFTKCKKMAASHKLYSGCYEIQFSVSVLSFISYTYKL